MCMVLFLASDKSLPLIDWDEKNPTFFVAELTESNQRIRQKFNRKFVYYLGSHSYCGCGFSYEQNPFLREADLIEEKKAKETVKKLLEYLSVALKTTDSVDLYSCWDGDYFAPADFLSVLNPNDPPKEKFGFREREFIEIKAV